MQSLLHRIRQRPKTVAVAVVLGLAVVAAGAWRAARAPVPAVHTVAVVRGAIEDVVLANGVLTPWRQVDVGAQASGQLRRIHVEPGQTVKQGQLLAEIDPTLAGNELKLAQSVLAGQLAQRRGKLAQRRQALAEAVRQRRLLTGAHTSQREAEAAEAGLASVNAALDELDAAIAQTRIRIDSGRATLAYTRIAAPMDGVVVSVSTQQGQTVIAAQQAPTILQLADLSRMKVRAQVSEADVSRLRPGLKAYFSMLGAPAKRRYGTVHQILPAAEKINSAVFYNAVFHVDNADGSLRSEMTAQVGIVLAEAANALIVPTAALEGDAAAPTVRVLGRDGRVIVRAIRTGIRAATRTQVLAGLSEGERVVVSEAETTAGEPDA
jgi:macrolide-specific efflux system membrane fusion protein